jgi:hypothetical protein
MSREIKFRAWEKYLKEIIPVYNIDFVNRMINTESAWRTFNEIELMQYTGLKDKNGKEIYEGDIVKASSQGSWGTFEVKWRQEGSPQWILYPAWQSEKFWHLHGTKLPNGDYIDLIEVIGNIYENPELLSA